jgi:hypothetical protein
MVLRKKYIKIPKKRMNNLVAMLGGVKKINEFK